MILCIGLVPRVWSDTGPDSTCGAGAVGPDLEHKDQTAGLIRQEEQGPRGQSDTCGQGHGAYPVNGSGVTCWTSPMCLETLHHKPSLPSSKEWSRKSKRRRWLPMPEGGEKERGERREQRGLWRLAIWLRAGKGTCHAELLATNPSWHRLDPA